MPIAAVPNYLGQDFSQASPGLRFGTCLRLWEPDWTIAKSSKYAASRSAAELKPEDAKRMRAIHQRQAELATPLRLSGHLLTLDAETVAPFTTGLGNEHPLENGFAFLNPYGLPYLPGSGVKGVLRQAARELAGHEWGDDHKGWTEAAITHLFGLESGDGDKKHQRGALMFWDVLPQLAGDSLQVDVMTPHQGHYYQRRSDAKSGASTSPHDSGQPTPINFLTVPPGSAFTFHVQCDLPFLRRLAPGLAEGGHWQTLVQAAFAHAFAWLGFGAKTAVGYGAMREDDEAAARRQRAMAVATAQAEEVRKRGLTAEEREAEEAPAAIASFRALLDAERQRKYKPGSMFDQQRVAFLQKALAWQAEAVRHDAAQVLRESFKFTDWPGKKERKQELKQWLTQLDGLA